MTTATVWSSRLARAVTFAFLATVVGSASVLVPSACTSTGCDGSLMPPEGDNPPTGEIVAGDPNSWESAPVGGEWIDLPGQRTQIFDLPQFRGRTIETIIPYLSTDPNPTQSGTSFAVGSGNIAEIPLAFNAYDPNGNLLTFVAIYNNSCAHYYLRLVVTFTPATAVAPASSDGDARASNAASADAGADVDPVAAPETDAAQ